MSTDISGKVFGVDSNNTIMGNKVMDTFLNFTNDFSDSFLYAYILQIILIVYMYNCVGTGRYWKIMLVGSIFGMMGAVVEHLGSSWLRTYTYVEDVKKSKALYCYLISEIGWIATEFSIPYLNLIKLNTLSQKRIIKIVNYVITVLFGLFSISRFFIGYLRVKNSSLYNPAIYHAHGIAFGITAIADGLLSVLIFKELNKSAKKTREKDGESFNLLDSFKKSSLFILFIVDLMSVILAILSIFINNTTVFGKSINRLVKPFHALKSNFLLILAIDAFIFKMRASVDGSYIVQRYLQKQSKLCSMKTNNNNNDMDGPLKRSASANMININTLTMSNNNNNSNINANTSNMNMNVVMNIGNSNNNNGNNNNNNNISGNGFPRIKGGHAKKGSTVSDIGYYMNKSFNNGLGTDIPTNTSNSMAYDHSFTTTQYNEGQTRAYLKNKRSKNGSKNDLNERNNPILFNPSIHSMTPLNSSYTNANYLMSSSSNTSSNENKIAYKSFMEFNNQMRKNFG
ncbi:hypothetical protein BCR32DRAFT_328887 [Anaeromyces robustus]|uniref:Uncharacterized protein n=1 Tax=Anaeromyces robustus TaxID=1754192 RepID=A0A1Y1WVH5_9FUNG|nr:hypothetical protein BCR32DRAFT_328887 [Anaeromyces robustus]|eukprot:ORX77561.1 hypothetical protein BCR32DRAFT_328887 [Anaeromyces robustus]